MNLLLHRENPYQYVGIDRQVLISVQERDFELLLKMTKGQERIIELRSPSVNGVLYPRRFTA
jgi:hypothetical protein